MNVQVIIFVPEVLSLGHSPGRFLDRIGSGARRGRARICRAVRRRKCLQPQSWERFSNISKALFRDHFISQILHLERNIFSQSNWSSFLEAVMYSKKCMNPIIRQVWVWMMGSASALGSWIVSDPFRANETSAQSLRKKPLLSYRRECEENVGSKVADFSSGSERTPHLRVEPTRKIETKIGREVRHGLQDFEFSSAVPPRLFSYKSQ